MNQLLAVICGFGATLCGIKVLQGPAFPVALLFGLDSALLVLASIAFIWREASEE